MKKKLVLIGVIIVFVLIIIRLSYLMFFKNEYYYNVLNAKIEDYVYINEYPRGRILDINGNVLVDNIGKEVIAYNKSDNNDEVRIAYQIAALIDIEKALFNLQQEFFLINNPHLYKTLSSKKEYRDYEERRITKDELHEIIIKKLTSEILNYSDLDQKAATIYFKMQKGYAYETKYIKDSNVTEEEIIAITKADIKGVSIKMTWERYYPYGSLVRNVFGNVSSTSTGIPKELLEYYSDSYSLEDRVGISYLELEYDKYLQAKKSKYQVNGDNSLTKIEDGNRGNDLVLSLDIDLIEKIQNILKEEMLKAKKEQNTYYYDHSYIIVSNPNTGEIIAPLSLKYFNDDFVDNTEKIILSSYTLGSVIKGASSTVNYLYDLIPIDKKINDACVKLYLVPEKCSHRRLGYIDDLNALAYSSNYYQYLTAIYLSNNKYTNNMKLEVSNKEFEIYRNVFSSYGLGVKTNVDLPNEQVGISGKKVSADLLLNLAIGQYDTYTPIELTQYINTIASGYRMSPSFLVKVIDYNGKIIYQNKPTILNQALLNEEKISRIRLGFKNVFSYGTAKNYASPKINPAGKTGTSETFIDTNNDNIMDTPSVTTSVAMYFPYDNPLYSLTIISPNISYGNDSEAFVSNINKRLTKQITELLLEKD